MQAAPHTLISEWVLVEWSSGLAKECRDRHITYADFKANEVALMTDIATGEIVVVPTTTAIERVRSLVEYVGARKQRALKAGDAMQIVTAMEATTRYGKLCFVCCDKKLASVITDMGPISSALDALYIQP